MFAFGEKGVKTRRPSCERHFLQSALRERFAQLPANSNDFPKIAGWGSLHFRLSGGEGGIRTLDRVVRPYNGLANRRLQPLGHLSGVAELQLEL